MADKVQLTLETLVPEMDVLVQKGYFKLTKDIDLTSYTDWDSLEGTVYNRYDLTITSDGAPITIIGAKDDAACPYLAMKEFIIQLQNGGAEANIITLPNDTTADYGNGHSNTLGHRAPIFYNQVDGVGYGWWYAVQDIKARFLKN